MDILKKIFTAVFTNILMPIAKATAYTFGMIEHCFIEIFHLINFLIDFLMLPEIYNYASGIVRGV